jgi:hypothetical protein
MIINGINWSDYDFTPLVEKAVRKSTRIQPPKRRRKNLTSRAATRERKMAEKTTAEELRYIEQAVNRLHRV